jgi:hypothetical protein
MVANELVLLDQMLQQLQRVYPTPLTEDRVFDLFVSEQVLCDYRVSAEDAALGIVRGENDGALGGVYVFLDGRLLSEESDVLKDDFAPGKIASGTSLDLRLVRSDRRASFIESCLDEVGESVRRLLSLAEKDADLAELYGPAVVTRTGMFRTALRKFAARNLQIGISFSYATRGQVDEISSNIKMKAEELEQQLSNVLTGVTARVEFVGAAELWKQASSLGVERKAENRKVLRVSTHHNKLIDRRSDLSVESKKMAVTKRLLVWFLFGAIFGLLPLFAQALKEVLSPAIFHINSILQSGELFIVSAVLSAGALGELLATVSRRVSLVTIVAGFFCLTCFAGNTIAYVTADAAAISEIVAVSLWFFPPTLVASGVCIGVAASR